MEDSREANIFNRFKPQMESVSRQFSQSQHCNYTIITYTIYQRCNEKYGKNVEIYHSDAMMQMNDCASKTPTPSNLEVNKHNKYSYGIVSIAAFIVCVYIA